MRTTGPILAMGAINVGNSVIINNQPMDWRVPIATGIAAGLFGLLESAWEDGAVALAWLALGTLMITRTNPKVPSPVESVLSWWEKGK